jgi:uncharacterized membrane protein
MNETQGRAAFQPAPRTHPTDDGALLTMEERAIMIALRLVHILAGLFWVGAMVTLTAFFAPAVRASGPAAGKIMIELMLKRKLRVWLTSAMGLTVLSGILMMWRLDVVTHHAWIRTASGKTLMFGALAALIAGFAGGAVAGPANQRLATIGQSVGAGGGTPTQDQQTEMAKLQKRSGLAMRLTVVFVLIAAGAMAVARYV